jgi:hypothetical protein
VAAGRKERPFLPVCVRTVDQGARHGGQHYWLGLCSSRGLHVYAVWVRLFWLSGRLTQLKVSDLTRGPV